MELISIIQTILIFYLWFRIHVADKNILNNTIGIGIVMKEIFKKEKNAPNN